MTAAELVAHPERIADADPGAIPALIVQLASVQAQLAARALALAADNAHGTETPAGLLTVADVVKRLRLTRDFVYDHADELGAVRVGRALRFTEQGVARYLERRARR